MKKPSSILRHLFVAAPKFYEQKCFRKLVSLLPNHLQKAILYAFRKNTILYFVLKHPGFQMEINYNKKVINDILKTLQNRYPWCQGIQITQIRAFSKFEQPQKVQKPRSILCYKERATGNFTIKAKEPHIREIFQHIQEAIRKNG